MGSQEFYSQRLGRWTRFNETIQLIEREDEKKKIDEIKKADDQKIEEYLHKLSPYLCDDVLGITLEYLRRCPGCDKIPDKEWHEESCEFYKKQQCIIS